MNIITFDIEEWAIALARQCGTPQRYAQYEACLHRILDSLDEHHTKGTFFCTGEMALHFPIIVKLINSRGHEIGCHSHVHSWMNKMTQEEARYDTQNAVDALEQCVGIKIKSYRAPAFSIGEDNVWMFDILAGCGIERDSSVFPAPRALGGFPTFGSQTPCVVSHAGVAIKEFPIPMMSLMGRKVAYSGGGYFRLFPLCMVKQAMYKSDYNMTYFHIQDLIMDKSALKSRMEYEAYYKEPGTIKNRYVRYIKANIGKSNAMDKLLKLVDTQDFVNMDYVDGVIDWETMAQITL